MVQNPVAKSGVSLAHAAHDTNFMFAITNLSSGLENKLVCRPDMGSKKQKQPLPAASVFTDS
jgi:hypothetical protein